MRPKKRIWVLGLVFSIISCFPLQATELGLGDIAITGYNADNPDEWSFVLLTDISGTTVISFTDAGWFAAGGFRPGEGTIRLTINGAQTCGTEILVSFASGSWTASIGTIAIVEGALQLSSSGDQIFAYNGTTVPTAANQTAFITGLHFAGASYDADAIGSVESAQPPIFAINPGNDFAVAHQDNGKYGCSLASGLPADLRASIYTAANWSFTNSSTQRFNLSQFCNFSCTDACTDPVITSLSTNSTIGSNTFCPGDAVVITVNGSANDATSWNLYAGSCGGTLVSSIPVSSNTFSFTASSTVTLYVGGTGGCVATPNCTAITITVNGLTANAGSDQKVSGSTTANIAGNGSGNWTIIGAGDGNGFFDGVPGTLTSSIASTTFSGTAGQEYELRWTVTNAGCSNSSDDVVITFLNPTTLGLGDIAFTGYNADNPDEFRFVLLTDIDAGTQITFTDNGWLGTQNGFRGGENTITYEFCRPYSCGDEFSATSGVAVQDEASNEAAPIVSGSSPALATSGDQIFAYQGAAPTSGGASNWIAAIQMNGGWDANATNAETSAQPTAFTDGVNSISIAPEADNAKYDCSITTNSPANLRAAINTASNWTAQDAILSLDFCSFTCGSCVEPVLTSVSAPTTACPGQTVALTINGTLNGANEWAIYTGSCGGTLVGTTTSSSFNVSPTGTTTYYVSGRGGCVVSETCQTATITIGSVQADAGPNDVEKINASTSTTLQANGSLGDGTWTFVDTGDGQGSFSDNTDPTATFSGTAGQSYTLKWTIDNSAASCPDTEDEVTIVFLSQTSLALGDIAFIAYSSDDDDFAFVILKDINAGTTISFTDRGWFSAGGFRSGEGTITVEFCRPYSCGDEFNVFDATQEIKDASGQLAGDVTGVQLDPSTTGDQIFAYQGTEPTAGNETAFLAAIQMNGAWDANAVDGNTSAQPSVFTDGVNSISFTPEVQNAYLDCSKVSTASATQINNSANWITSNTISATLPLNCNLACCTPGVVTSISGSTGPLCPSSTQPLSVVGNLNDDQTWVWYTGSCGGTQVATGANFNVSPTTTTTYYVRAEGTCSGTSGACASLTITIEDNTDPVASCPADITVNNDAGFCSAVVSFNATATDNCGGNVDITYSQNPGTAFNVGTTQVDVTATDDLGNTDNCSFDVTVTDNENPVAICPADIEVNNDPGQCGAVVSFSASATDNCPGATAAAVPSSGSLFPVGLTSVTVTATDASGNTADCTFSVTVNDNEVPTFSNCPGNISISNDVGDCGAIVNWTPPTLSDNCPSTSQNASHNPGDFFSVGSTTVTYSGSDGAGNNASNCSFTVTVNDTEDPVPTCPSNLTVNNDPGQCSAVVNFAATATDNCDTNVDIVYSQNPGTAFNVGTTTVNVTTTDEDNNSAACSFEVTVIDNEAPVAICPASIPDVVLDASGNGTLSANIGDGSSTDNCSATETSPSASFTCDDVGTQLVTLTATDPAGGINTIDCSFNVVDNGGGCNQPPVAECQSISVSADLNSCETTITAAQINNGSSDPDGTTLQLTLDNTGPFAVGGPYTVELTVSDGSLTDKCTAQVTITDDQAPSFSNCPGNISVSNDPGDCGAEVAWTPPTFEDNCPGATENSTYDPGDFFPVGATVVTYSGTDAAVNVATDCVFTVTVSDAEAPSFSNCPGNISVNNDPGDCGASVAWTPPTFDDNCPGATDNSSHNPGDFFPIGSTVVTYSGVDVAGNAAANCNFTVTVNKTGDPDLLNGYTVISYKEIKMKKNTVESGGLGIVKRKKKVKLEQGTMVTAANTFVKAPKLERKGGSQVTTYIRGRVDENLIPAFLSGNACHNDVDIPDNSAPVILTEDCYGKIEVGKNVTITFSNHATVKIEEMDLKKGATILFDQSTNLLIKKDFKGGKEMLVSNEGHEVWIFAKEKVKIEESSTISANIYTKEKLEVEKGKTYPTRMTGLFIARDKVDAKENVIWNWDADACESESSDSYYSPFVGTTESEIEAPVLENIQIGQTDPIIDLSVFPNPFQERTNIRFFLPKSARVTVEIYNLQGQRIKQLVDAQLAAGPQHLQWDGIATNGLRLESGLYIVNLRVDDERQTAKLNLIR